MARGPDPKIQTLPLLRVFVVSPDPAFVPAEIAKEFDTSSETARSAMDRAVREGYLKKKKPGKRTVVYWITEAGEAYFYENADES